MIRSFKDRVTLAVFGGQCPKGFPGDIFPIARRKLGMLNAAPSLDGLRIPPANRALAGAFNPHFAPAQGQSKVKGQKAKGKRERHLKTSRSGGG